MMAFRPYTVEILQHQLRASHARHRASGNIAHTNEHDSIIQELGRLGRWDIVELEQRHNGLVELGYDADRIIADVQAGRDPLISDAERRRVRRMVSDERLALVRIGLMNNHNDGSWCKLATRELSLAPELAYGHPARAERRRQIIILAGAARARRAIDDKLFFFGHIMHWDDKRKYMGEIWRQQGAMRLEAARRDKQLALLGDKPHAAIQEGRP